MTESRFCTGRNLSSVMASCLTVVLSLFGGGCSSSQTGQSAPVANDEPLASNSDDVSLLPVVSASSGLFVIIGPAAPTADEVTSRRDYIGYNADLIIQSRAGTAPSSRYTVVSRSRHCVATVRGRAALWIARRGHEARLTEPVDAVELEGCEELEFGEWLVALDGDQENVRWVTPEHETTFDEADEVADIVSNIRGVNPESFGVDANHLARFVLAGTELTALVMSNEPLGAHLPSASGPCESERHTAISIVREREVVASFDAGEHLGVVQLGETRFVVHIGDHRNELRVWRVDESGLELIADAVRPTYREPSGC